LALRYVAMCGGCSGFLPLGESEWRKAECSRLPGRESPAPSWTLANRAMLERCKSPLMLPLLVQGGHFVAAVKALANREARVGAWQLAECSKTWA
jgi:hypothetical protein